MHKDLPANIRDVIKTRAQIILEDIIFMIDRDQITEVDGCYRFIDEAHVDETDVSDLDADDQLKLLAYHADDYGLELHSTKVGDLRWAIEKLAAQLVCYLAQAEASGSISELEELVEGNGFEFEDIAAKNPYFGAVHRGESELNGCMIYEYRKIEDEIFADVWEKELDGGVKVFLTRPLKDIPLPPIADLAVSERPEEGLYVVKNRRGSAVVYQVFPESHRMIIQPGAFEPPFASSEEAEDWVVSHMVSRAEMQWDPTPRAGDLVQFPDGRRGVIDSAKYPGDLLQVCLNWSAFRAVLHVSCSGGPIPAVQMEDLTFSGRLGVAAFWRWKDGIAQADIAQADIAQADNGVSYTATVPIWNVAGEKEVTS